MNWRILVVENSCKNKILVILSCNTHWAPYYFRYENILVSKGIPFDLLIWNRENLDEGSIVKAPLIQFNCRDNANNGNKFKILKFFRYAHFIKNYLKKHQEYNKIIFLGTYAFVPALLAGFLKKKYYKKYWIDVRDLTYESFAPFFRLEKNAITNSYCSVVSSKGFIQYLPPYDYRTIHNIDPSMDEYLLRFKHTKSDVIRIGYYGNLSYWTSCKEMLDLFANDQRFIMKFAGPNVERIRDYCNVNHIVNVAFHGEFPKNKTVDFYCDTDIIYNLYGSNNVNVRTALSNKLYYGLSFELPILVNSNTLMADIVSKYGVGFVFENNHAFPDKLFNEYSCFRDKHFSFKNALADLKNEDLETLRSLYNFLETNFENGVHN